MACRSSWPDHPTETPPEILGPPCPHVPRLTVGTLMSVLPRMMFFIFVSRGSWFVVRGALYQRTTDHGPRTTNQAASRPSLPGLLGGFVIRWGGMRLPVAVNREPEYPGRREHGWVPPGNRMRFAGSSPQGSRRFRR